MLGDSNSTMASYSLNIIRAKQIESQLPLSQRNFKVKLMFKGEEKQTSILPGNNLDWNQVLMFLSEEEIDDNSQLSITLIMDDHQVGVKQFSIKRIKTQFVHLSKQTIKLVKNQKPTAELQIMIEFQRTQENTLAAPKVSLAPNYANFSQPDGLQLNRTNKINFFSCMDQNLCCVGEERDFEFFPSKFTTKFSTQ